MWDQNRLFKASPRQETALTPWALTPWLGSPDRKKHFCLSPSSIIVSCFSLYYFLLLFYCVPPWRAHLCFLNSSFWCWGYCWVYPKPSLLPAEYFPALQLSSQGDGLRPFLVVSANLTLAHLSPELDTISRCDTASAGFRVWPVP